MAINADQLLNRPSELHRRYGGRLAMQKAHQEKMVGGGPSNIVLSKKSIKGIEGIKINVIKIEDIFKGSLALDKKQLDDKKKATSRKRKDDIETKLETKPNVESGGKVKLPTAPRMGILDFVKNFIGNVLLGYFAVRLIKHLPKIMPIVKFLGNATDFIINTGGELLNGLITFAQKGQEAHDKTRGFIKNLGGENFAKGFDKFIGAIDTALFLTTVLAGSMAMESMSGGDNKDAPGRGERPGRGSEFKDPRKGFKGKQGWNLSWERATNPSRGLSHLNADRDIMKRYFQKYGRDAFVQRFGEEGLRRLPGGMARSGITNLARKGLVGLAGKGGAKMVLGFARPLLKRLPIIGALIDFGLSVALGEDPGRAAFKAIGAGLLGTVGAAIGSLAFGFGGIVGGILGSIGGDALGGALYDTFFGGKKPPQKGKVQGKAGGGITRGGKSAGGVKRTVSKGKYKRVLTPQKPSKTELKTEAFTKPENKTLKESTEELDKTKYFGPILAISSKIMNKEEPTDRDYQNVGLGINMLISQGVQQQQLKGGIVAKFAEGGLVDPDVLSAAETGGDISNWVAKTFRGAIETGAQKTMRMIREMKEMKEKTGSGEDEYDDSDGGGGGGGSLTTGQWGPILDLIASKESGGSYTKMYGGKENPSLVNMTLQEVSTFQAAHAKKTGSAAMGRYQFMNALGQGAAVGLKPTDKFSPENQDKMAVGLIVQKRKVTLDMIKSNPDEAMIRLGMEWAAIGMPKSMRGHRRMVAAGETYYAGDGVNKAHITPAQMRAAFAKTVGGGYSQAELAKSQAGSVGSSMQLGKGYGGAGSKIAGDLGDYMKQTKIPTGEIHQHPRHPGLSKRSYFSYHNQGRAIDLGGYGPAHPSSGGRDEQAPILRALVAWNKQKGVTPVEVIHGSPAFRGFGKYESAPNALHSHHVHAAYAKGGRVSKLTFAMLGEKGPEFVFDADTTAGLDKLAPQLLEKLNIAKTKPQLASILQSYASYDARSEASQTFIVQSSPPLSEGYSSDGGGGGVLIASGGGGNPFDALVMGS